jgi:hypothetical protein
VLCCWSLLATGIATLPKVLPHLEELQVSEPGQFSLKGSREREIKDCVQLYTQSSTMAALKLLRLPRWWVVGRHGARGTFWTPPATQNMN